MLPSHPHVVEPLELKCEREVSEDHVVVTGCTTSNQPVAVLCSFEQQPQAECETQCTVCMEQHTDTYSLSDLHIGTFPVHINLTRNVPGVYSLEITATDVFNLTDRNIITYTSAYLNN